MFGARDSLTKFCTKLFKKSSHRCRTRKIGPLKKKKNYPNRSMIFLVHVFSGPYFFRKTVTDASWNTGVGGHPGVFSIFLDRAPRFFLRIFTGNFWIFLRTRCPLPKYVLGFPFSGGFFWPFSGFPSFYPHCHGVILKKMGKFLADTRFGHYHQRVA